MGPPDQYSPAPGPAPRRKRPPWLLPAAIGAAVAAAVIIALVLSLSPPSSNRAGARGTTSPSHSAAPSATPTPTVGNLTPAQLQAGDCMTGANLQLNKNTPWPNLATAVPCDQPHTAEVFYANNYYWPRNSPYPGDAAIATASDTACNNAFAAYVGISYTKSVYSRIKLIPVAKSWARGDRALHCVAYYATSSQPAGVTLTSSIKGSAK
jgi:hypothetical protein